MLYNVVLVFKTALKGIKQLLSRKYLLVEWLMFKCNYFGMYMLVTAF